MFYFVINRKLVVWRHGMYGWKLFKGCWVISVALWVAAGARVADTCAFFLGAVGVWALLMVGHKRLA